MSPNSFCTFVINKYFTEKNKEAEASLSYYSDRYLNVKCENKNIFSVRQVYIQLQTV